MYIHSVHVEHFIPHIIIHTCTYTYNYMYTQADLDVPCAVVGHHSQGDDHTSLGEVYLLGREREKEREGGRERERERERGRRMRRTEGGGRKEEEKGRRQWGTLLQKQNDSHTL